VPVQLVRTNGKAMRRRSQMPSGHWVVSRIELERH
jgi:hypothetical protein